MTTPIERKCCYKCRASDNMHPEARKALEKISPPGRACWMDNCVCHTTEHTKDGWEERFDEKFFAKDWYWNDEVVRNFIRELLSEDRAHLRKEIEKLWQLPPSTDGTHMIVHGPLISREQVLSLLEEPLQTNE